LDSHAFPIAASALASFLLAKLLVLTADHHGRFTMDAPGAVQKFHSQPTPRVGGIGIYLALLAASLLVPDPDARRILDTILLAGVPALLVGLLEDVTKNIRARTRLLATMASGGLACWFSGVSLTHLQLPLLDAALGWAPAALLFTAFAVSGVANATNIIDGFNGLASGTTTIALLALACIAALVGDTPLVLTAVILAAAVTGFWLVNFPWGKLFLGDGGAYFAGFALAWLAVLLPMRNAGVSPWASFLVCAYPIIEVIYSIVRRRRGNVSPSDADRRHLHSLVALKVIHRRFPSLDPVLQNSAVSVIMWACTAVPAFAAIAFYQRTGVLILFAVACAAAYHSIYLRLART
jgi:UDP-N-acetylmuramyl pentapeptide phosphotransferase/UDP-N-acetylglucosamine-1-phosphate transferase